MPLSYEEARELYRPSYIRFLFIGESPPAGGKFFFVENSNLYYATKEAFQKASKEDFNCKVFQRYGCWLYDVCNVPVNNMESNHRKAKIQEGITALRQVLNEYKPEYVVVVKKGYFGTVVYPNVLNSGYNNGQTAHLLPFPLYQYREQYVQELTTILKKTILKEPSNEQAYI